MNQKLEPEVIAYIIKGQKIKAVKKLYEIRRISLKQAKELVDSYEIEVDYSKSQDSNEKPFGHPIYLVIIIGFAGLLLFKYIN